MFLKIMDKLSFKNLSITSWKLYPIPIMVHYVGRGGHGIESVSPLSHPAGVSEVDDLRVQTFESEDGDVFDDVQEL